MAEEGAGPPLSFRYRGPINWVQYYKGTLAWFRDRNYEIVESKYKDKTNEFEGEIRAEQRIDMTTLMAFKVEFKAVDMVPTGKPGEYNGKVQIFIAPLHDTNYARQTFAGKQTIFEEGSWLETVHRRIMFREIDEDVDGTLIIMSQQYLDWVKSLCHMEARSV